MFFPFNLQKAIQAAGVILDTDDRQEMEYLRLLKLLYIAERESLAETGSPIIGSRLVAMKNGPLHSRVYDLIKSESIETPEWSQFLRTEHYYIRLVENPGVDALSRYEIRKLREVEQRYQNTGTWELVEITHEFEEWGRNYPDPRENTSREIALEDVIEAVGGCCESVRADAEEANEIQKLFG